MSQIILKPTPKITKATLLLSDVISGFLGSRSTLPPLGKYESEDEALNLMYLLIRNVEGVLHLAQSDLILYPAAMTLTRTVFEVAIRIRWMIQPSDPFQREIRWLAHLKTEENFYERFAKRLTDLEINADNLWELKGIYEDFREGVEKKLPKNYKPLAKIPDLASMMKLLGENDKYSAYLTLSQYSHGTHNATSLFRKHLGIYKEFGEFIEPRDWHTPLSICWYSLFSSGLCVIEGLGGDPSKFLTEDFIAITQESINALKLEK